MLIGTSVIVFVFSWPNGSQLQEWCVVYINLFFLGMVWLFATSPYFGRAPGKATQVCILGHGLILVSRSLCQTLKWLLQTPNLGDRLACILSCQLCVQSDRHNSAAWMRAQCHLRWPWVCVYVHCGMAMSAGTTRALWEIWALLDRQLEVGTQVVSNI